MPAVALSRVAARVVESGPGGEDLTANAWQRLEALPDPRSPQGRIYPLACLIADQTFTEHARALGVETQVLSAFPQLPHGLDEAAAPAWPGTSTTSTSA